MFAKFVPASTSTIESQDSAESPKLTEENRSRPPAQGFSVGSAPKKILAVEYAVRGEVLARAIEMEKNLASYKHKFDKLLPCHIGNPHMVGMKPLTYLRQMISLVTDKNFHSRSISQLTDLGFAPDTIARAKRYHQAFVEPGAYTHSQGAPKLREIIADFFLRRDGVRGNSNHIFLANGASDIINSILTCMVGEASDGICVPKPQYPLYAAVITKLGGTSVYYTLNEEKGWTIDMDNLRKTFEDAVDKEGVQIKAIVIISPGNPAPTFLKYDDILKILQFAYEKNILCIADEVYQENIYRPGDEFVSFRKVLHENKYLKTQLASIHSSSKGFYGECGFRGGVCLFDNINEDAIALLYKMRSVDLCSNTIGQAVMTAVLDPPKPGEPSFALYTEEKNSILEDLKKKANYTTGFLNSIGGISCQPIVAALYAFPNIKFSQKAFDMSRKMNKSVETYYCLNLLEETGIIATPGCGFGQQENSHHIRLTILPDFESLKEALNRYKKFHIQFTTDHSDRF